MRRLVDLVVVWWLWFVHATGLYGAWSRAWRAYELRRFGWRPPPARDVITLVRWMRPAAEAWTADAWWRLWDTVSPPGRLEARIQNPDDVPHSVDCDEFAVDAAASLGAHLALVEAGRVQLAAGEQLADVHHLVQVIWRRDGGGVVDGLNGHHVAAFRWLPPSLLRLRFGVRSAYALDEFEAGGLWWHVGNWGLRGPFASLDEVALSVGVEAGGRVLAARVGDPRTLRGWRTLRPYSASRL